MAKWASFSLLVIIGCGSAERSSLEAPDPQIPEDAGVSDGGRRDVGPRDASVRDVSTSDAEAPLEGVEVGTGESGFMPIGTGDRVPLTAGPQGGGAFYGYHIWFAVRVDDSFDPERAQIQIDVRPVGSSEPLGNGSYEFDLVPDPSGGSAIFGMRALLRDCCMAEDHDLILSAVVTDQDGHTGSDHRTVRGEMKCFDPAYPTFDPCP